MTDLTYQVPPKLRRPFRVGEVVAVCDRTGERIGSYRVSKVGPKVVRLAGDGRRWRASDGWWIGENRAWPFPSIRQLTKAEHVEATQTVLMLVMDKWPSKKEIGRWCDEVRDAVEQWAVMVHLRASDNPVRVPKRPAVLDRWWCRQG